MFVARFARALERAPSYFCEVRAHFLIERRRPLLVRHPERRAANGYHHLGDLILRVRAAGSGAWQKYDTADARQTVLPLPVSGQSLAAADLTPTLPADIPVQVTRS